MRPCCHSSIENAEELLNTRQKGIGSTVFPPPFYISHTHGFIILITSLSTCFGRSSPVLRERGKEKSAGSLLFSEGCTGFNSQIIISSLIFVIPPSWDSCAHHKKICIILLFYMCRMLLQSFQYFYVFVKRFLHFQLNTVIWFSKHTSLTRTFEKFIILSNSLTLDEFLCLTVLLPVYRLYLQNPVLSTTNLSCYASASFMVYELLWALCLFCLLSLLCCISCE